jgi:hypothetical protein
MHTLAHIAQYVSQHLYGNDAPVQYSYRSGQDCYILDIRNTKTQEQPLSVVAPRVHNQNQQASFFFLARHHPLSREHFEKLVSDARCALSARPADTAGASRHRTEDTSE